MVTVYVYILRCADGSYYVGKFQGDRVEWRVADHNNGVYPDAYTAKRRPVTLVWSTWFGRFDEAVSFERQLKGWSRAKKEALIRGDEAALKALSKRGVKPSTILRDASLRDAPQDEERKPLHPEEPRSGVTKDEGIGRRRILRDAAEGAAPQDEDRKSLHPEEPQSGVTKGEGIGRRRILRDAAEGAAPQDEERKSLHPEEPQSGVTKGEGTKRQCILRDAALRDAPQDEERQR